LKLRMGGLHFVYLNVMGQDAATPIYASAIYQPVRVSDVAAVGIVQQDMIVDNGYLKYGNPSHFLYGTLWLACTQAPCTHLTNASCVCVCVCVSLQCTTRTSTRHRPRARRPHGT
jgi:hypothetical protein